MHLKSQLLTKRLNSFIVQTQCKECLEIQSRAAVALYADCLCKKEGKKNPSLINQASFERGSVEIRNVSLVATELDSTYWHADGY